MPNWAEETCPWRIAILSKWAVGFTVLRSGPREVIVRGMWEWLILAAHLFVTIVKIATPGSALNRSRKRAPKRVVLDRVLLGLCALGEPSSPSESRGRHPARDAAAISVHRGDVLHDIPQPVYDGDADRQFADASRCK